MKQRWNCANLGKSVTVIEMLDEAKGKMKLRESASNNVALELLNIFSEKGIPVHYNTALSEIKDRCIIVKNQINGELSEIHCDTVLLAMGMLERWRLVDDLRRCVPESNVHIVGDCRNVATIAEAINQAFQACIHI